VPAATTVRLTAETFRRPQPDTTGVTVRLTGHDRDAFANFR